MPDMSSKTRWESQNVVQVTVVINKNQDPELYAAMLDAASRSGLARELIKEAFGLKNKGGL